MPIAQHPRPSPHCRRTDRSRPHGPAFAAAFALLTALAVAPRVRAGDGEDKTAEARTLAQEANTQYAVGEFLQAAEKYQKAYKLKPDAALLYNAAQSYRMAGDNNKALLLYKNYVMFHPNAGNIPNVQQQIVKLQEAIAAQDKARTQPPTSTESTASVGSTEPAAAPPPATSSLTTVPSAPPPASGASPAVTVTATSTSSGSAGEEPLYKKWWLWTAVGVVVAGGVVTALLLTRSEPAAWNTAPDFGPGAKLVSP